MRRCGNSRRKGHDVEAKEFGRFIAGMRKEKKMTQAELAEKIHVTDKAVSRWERGLGFPDIQTIEPLAQALGISVLELMRSERQEKAKEEAAPEIQYTQKEVAEMLQNAGDISRQQKKQDRNANVIAGFLVIGVAAAAWAAKIVNVGGGLILGGLVAAAFVSLWYFFQNLDDEESRKVYGAAFRDCAADCLPERKGRDAMSLTEIESYRELIQENIGYEYLCQQYETYREDLDEIVELIVETVCAKRKTTRIAGSDFPHEIVRSRFLKLDNSHIEFVMDCLQKNTTEIRNMKQYLLTVLFNAPTTISNHYTSQVNHDLYGGW